MSDERPTPTGLAGGSNLDQLMPVVLFFVLFNTVGIIWAVLAATAWSIKAAVGRRNRGLAIGWWLPSVTTYLLARAAVTIAADRELIDFGISTEAVYFGIGFATKFLIGVAVAVTILIGKPLLSWAIPKAVRLPQELLVDPRYTRTMANASWVIVFYEVLSAIWDVWLFNNSGSTCSSSPGAAPTSCSRSSASPARCCMSMASSSPSRATRAWRRCSSAGRFVTHGPLVVLHDHLDGGVRPSTVLDLCHAVGVATPADDAAALGEWMTITPGMELVDAFSRFDLVNAGLQTADALRRVALEGVEDLAADGVIHAEFRFAPLLHTAPG